MISRALELGGSRERRLADAELERAAAAAPYAVFDNAGQDCCTARGSSPSARRTTLLGLSVVATRGVWSATRPRGRRWPVIRRAS
jgi:hypothetical protein